MAQVINIEKHKDNTKISSIAKHNLRCYIPKNVDPKRQNDNVYFVGRQGQNDILPTLKEKLKDVKHRSDANKVINLVFSASKEEFEAMGPEKAKKWANEMHNYCVKKFGKENVLYSVLHRDETTDHLHFAFTPLRDGKLQSNYWFDGPAKLQKFRKEIYEINKKYGIGKDKPAPKTEEKKAERKDIDDFYKKVKKCEKVDNKIQKEIEAVQGLGSFAVAFNPKAKIEALTPTIKNIVDYANTASTRIKRLKEALISNKEKLKEKDEEIKKKDDELNRFAEIENIKKLTYAELSSLNNYVNKTYGEAIEERENKAKQALKPQSPVLSASPESKKTIDKKIKPR